MNYVHFMQVFEATQNLEAVLPNLVLIEPLSFLEAFLDELGQVPHGRKLHDNAQMVGLIIEKGLAILNNILVLYRSQYSNLVQRVLLIFFLQVHDLHLR